MVSKQFPKIPFLPVILVVLVVLAAAGGVYVYTLYQGAQKQVSLLKNPQQAAKKETQELVAEVGKLLALPQGETPTIATVTDKKKLQNQPFFAHAENGDKVLIYTQAKKAILYNPNQHKIIEVAPVNIGQGQGVAGAATTPSVAPIKIALYNGTTVVGLTNSVESELKTKIANAQVVVKENAAKDDYTATVVVDLSGKNQQAAASIAQLVGGTVSALPEGEKKANADILVILGKQE